MFSLNDTCALSQTTSKNSIIELRVTRVPGETSSSAPFHRNHINRSSGGCFISSQTEPLVPKPNKELTSIETPGDEPASVENTKSWLASNTAIISRMTLHMPTRYHVQIQKLARGFHNSLFPGPIYGKLFGSQSMPFCEMIHTSLMSLYNSL